MVGKENGKRATTKNKQKNFPKRHIDNYLIFLDVFFITVVAHFLNERKTKNQHIHMVKKKKNI